MNICCEIIRLFCILIVVIPIYAIGLKKVATVENYI